MQKPTKAFADMIAETADNLQAILTEIYPDGDNQGALFVSPNHLRQMAQRYAEQAANNSAARIGGGLVTETSKIYVASSWRNHLQVGVVHTLRAAGFDVYDFKNPPNGSGFHWSEVGLQRDADTSCVGDYVTALEHPRSIEGFNSDFEAMEAADTFVLVLPCGRSAHLELRWAVGAGKRTAILLEDPCTPELMYKMVDYLAPSLFDLLGWLGVKD